MAGLIVHRDSCRCHGHICSVWDETTLNLSTLTATSIFQTVAHLQGLAGGDTNLRCLRRCNVFEIFWRSLGGWGLPCTYPIVAEVNGYPDYRRWHAMALVHYDKERQRQEI